MLVCVTDQINGHLSWHNASYGDELIVNLQQMDQEYMNNSINYTLLLKQEKVDITSTQREVRISSAVLKKATTDTIIRCWDGDPNVNNAKVCHIQIKGE